MTTPAPAARPVPVRTVTDRFLNRLQSRQEQGFDRGVRARLTRSTPPSDPGLWVALELTGLHPATGPGPDEETYARAATAVCAAAQLWARTQVPHVRSTEQRDTRPGTAAARTALTRPTAEADLARALRAATLDALLPWTRRLFRGADALDYGLLADDLHTWQTPGGPDRVHRAWAADYTRAKARAQRRTTTA
ncbi:type I-E CRISPR-associated protein Cse2/CasB [Streptomyces yaizuensis]|uniref:Type I-E CRISPR-associated protein Cse2/CasB n=1 Tax=Streptomyces yaizuensis TaxID=2989713 RepID=A0ABQ5P6H9_9ACTN|nr:type I-E CRISPR-associated protein Cse2/CasB [Streptomyces sp. YSPA8]GLF98167.1 type I-E CRISPR-associated protein Cse2/CasB [Streptomyces sp. YSPA8]